MASILIKYNLVSSSCPLFIFHGLSPGGRIAHGRPGGLPSKLVRLHPGRFRIDPIPPLNPRPPPPLDRTMFYYLQPCVVATMAHPYTPSKRRRDCIFFFPVLKHGFWYLFISWNFASYFSASPKWDLIISNEYSKSRKPLNRVSNEFVFLLSLFFFFTAVPPINSLKKIERLFLPGFLSRLDQRVSTRSVETSGLKYY